MGDKPRIFHDFSKCSDNGAHLIPQIDAAGGWPAEAKSLVMRHGTERDCYFTTKANVRDEWNTTVMTADEYHFAKLSEKFKAELRLKTEREYHGRIRP